MPRLPASSHSILITVLGEDIIIIFLFFSDETLHAGGKYAALSKTITLSHMWLFKRT